MFLRKLLITAATLAATAGWTSAYAFESGFPGWVQQPGVTIGASAGTPPTGIYMFNQAFTYQANVTGPGNALLNPTGTKTGAQGAIETNGFLFVPGWNFLGATYSALLVVPFQMDSAGSPVNTQASGMHNTYFVPVELSWKLGSSGFFVKTGLGIYAPDGTTTGFNKLGNVGNPWWTFQPAFLISYLKDGWNLTAHFFDEINTKNTTTQYQTGDIFHAEFTATKTVGKWTAGPVGYYVGQITNDTSSAFYRGAINLNRYDIWAAGALIGYNFGPATLNVWGTSEVSAHASGGTPVFGIDRAVITKGFTVFGSLSYQIWAPEAPAAPALTKLRK